MLAINNCVSQSTQKTAYEMVFGQPTRNDHEFWLELHKQFSNNLIINEEELPQSISEIFQYDDEEVTLILHKFFKITHIFS